MQWCLSPHHSQGFLRAEKVRSVKKGEQICHTEYLYFRIPERYGLVNITSEVQDCLERSGVEEGLCYVGAMHITAGIYVNDAEGGLLKDISRWIDQLAPFGKEYHHHQTGEDNGDAHLKSYLTNHQITVPITAGEFDFGTWQQIFYAEFDGLREKRVLVKVLGF